MSSNKRSLGSLIVLLLIFALVAAGSWFFFNKKNGVDLTQAKNDIADKIAQGINTGDEAEDSDGHGGHAHGDHGDGVSNVDMGTKGTIYKLNPPALYGTRGVGNPDAPVHIQEFFSLTCNHCAAFHKETYQEIKTNLIDTGKVYFIYQEFPLNGPALYGSMIARCLPEERYTGFVDILLRSQDKWAFGGDFKGALLQNAKLAGMSEEEFNTCFNNKELQKTVASNIKEASEAWKVNSTPSFVFNDGERILYGGKPYESFEAIVNELTGENVSGKSAEELELDRAIIDIKDKTVDSLEAMEEKLGAPIKDFNDGAASKLKGVIQKGADVAGDAKNAATKTLEGAMENDTVKATMEKVDGVIDRVTESTSETIGETINEAAE